MHWNKCQNKHVRVYCAVSAEWTVCNQLHLSVRALVLSRGLEVWSVSCPLRPHLSWQRVTERCPVLDVCCLLLHLDLLPRHVSSFPPQEHFCRDLSHPGFSLLSSSISSPCGIAEADEGVSDCSLPLWCAFLVTSQFLKSVCLSHTLLSFLSG